MTVFCALSGAQTCSPPPGIRCALHNNNASVWTLWIPHSSDHPESFVEIIDVVEHPHGHGCIKSPDAEGNVLHRPGAYGHASFSRLLQLHFVPVCIGLDGIGLGSPVGHCSADWRPRLESVYKGPKDSAVFELTLDEA